MSISLDDVVGAHASLHAHFEDALYAVLEALVHLDVDDARTKLAAFDAAVTAHMAWEDATVLPAYAPLAPKDGPGRADHVAGDHVVLARNIAAAHDVIAALTPSSTLRDVLATLPAIYRVLSVLEHHTLREQNNVYPAVARAWSDDERADAVSALQTQTKKAS